MEESRQWMGWYVLGAAGFSRVFSPAEINQQHVEAAMEAGQKEVSEAQRGL